MRRVTTICDERLPRWVGWMSWCLQLCQGQRSGAWTGSMHKQSPKRHGRLRLPTIFRSRCLNLDVTIAAKLGLHLGSAPVKS